MKRKKQTVVLLVLLITSTGFVLALSTPISSPLIVMFGNSEEERTACKKLLEYLPDGIVVQYESIPFMLSKIRCIGPVIYLGHGTEKGIDYQSTSVSTRALANHIRNSVGKSFYLLSCGSEKTATLVSDRAVTGFPDLVDAEVGALAIATRICFAANRINHGMRALKDLLHTTAAKISGQSEFHELYVVYDDGGGGSSSGPYLSSAELNHFIATLILSNIIAIICASAVYMLGQHFAPAADASVTAVSTATRASCRTILSEVFKKGLTSISTIINGVFGGAWALATALGPAIQRCVEIAVNRMNLAEWALFISLTALEIVLIILSGGYGLVARCAAAAIVATTNAAVIGLADYTDADGVPCGSTLEAISQLS